MSTTGHGMFLITGEDEDSIREAAWRMSSFVAENIDGIDVTFEFVDWSE